MNERSVFLDALGIPDPAGRAAYLAGVCGDDPAFRRRIEELLAAAAPDTFMARPAAELTPTISHSPDGSPGGSTRSGGVELATGSGTPTAAGDDPLPAVPGYEIEAEIARGGMGVVFKARHLRLNRPAAVKMILGGGYHSPAARVRFLIEAEAVAQLTHPHVVGVYEFGQVEGLPFFALEYVAGGTLADKLARDGRFAPRAAAELVAKLADAVAAAHAKGIVHRDLKPANVLLTEAGEPKVTDFGLAKVGQSDMTTHGAILGTPSYMSPEQAAGRTADVGTPTDVYALGAVLYELLTGRPPFKSDSMMATIQQVLTRAPERPRAANATVPRDLETVCLKCLEKEPARRYETAAALAADLTAFLAGRPIQARPTGATERAWKWARRNPVVAGLTAAVGVLLAAAGVGGALAAERFRDEADAARKAKEEAEVAKVEADDARRATAAQLRKLRLSTAELNIRSAQAGQRFGSLALLQSALTDAREPGPREADRRQFRALAVAALALPDLEVLKEWPGCPPGTSYVAIDDAGERYARSGPDGAVTVRRVADDAVLFSLPATGRPQSVVLSGTGRVLILGDMVGPFVPTRGRVYDLSGPEPDLIHADSMVLDAQVGPTAYVLPGDGRVVYSTGQAVAVWDRATNSAAKYPLPGGQSGQAALSADGRRVAVPCGAVVHVREVDTGRVVDAKAFRRPVGTSALHPGGRFVAVNQGRTLVVRDLETGREFAELNRHRTDGIAVAFDPSGDYLVSNDWSQTVRVWDWRAEREVLTVPAGRGLVVTAKNRLLTVDPIAGTVRVSRLACGSERYRFGPTVLPSTGALAFDPAGRLAVVECHPNVETRLLFVCDAVRGTDLVRYPSLSTRLVRFATDGALLASDPQGVVRWPRSEAAGSGVVRFGPPERTPIRSRLDPSSADADGRVVAVPLGPEVAGAAVVRTDRINTTVSLGPQSDPRSTAVSPDGRLVATGTHDQPQPGVCVWDARTGELVKNVPAPGGPLVFSPDGKLLATTGGGNRLWRTDTWIEGPDIADPSPLIGGFVFSPDSRTIALTGYASIRLVRLADGAELVRLPYSEQAVIRPAGFSRDGSVLFAIGGNSLEFTAWDLRRLREQLTELNLDWDMPPFPPAPAPLAAVSRVEFVGADLLTDGRKRAAHEDGRIWRGLRRNPLDSEWYTRWGVASRDFGLTAPARLLFGVALALNPTREDAWLHRAGASLSLRLYAEAEKEASVVLARLPTQLTARRVRADARRELGRPADAAADLSVILRYHPNDCGTLIRRGAAYRAAGEADKAAADLRLADRLAAGARPEDRHDLAWQWLTGPPASRDPKRGLALAEALVADKPTDTAYLNTLGVAQFRNGRHKDAVETLAQTLPVEGIRWRAFDLFVLAMCHSKLGDPAKAKECFAQAAAADTPAAGLTPTQREELAAVRAEAADLLGRK